jgi:NAD(P)-dependent dehydrogenase (short-subunit alcohol dehydrogenase family)
MGLACAHGFATEGARLHIAARTESALRAAVEAIARISGTIVTIDNGNSVRVRA